MTTGYEAYCHAGCGVIYAPCRHAGKSWEQIEQDEATTPESSEEMILVPKALLGEVLESAQSDLWSVHGDRCVSTDKNADGRHECDVNQEKIYQLKALLSEPEIVA